ncbi:MAG TPA: STAS domain-containing protein [Spirochaetota bacterium]|nr:STAS domain-containing protein [Spirochaetota bacterium]
MDISMRANNNRMFFTVSGSVSLADSLNLESFIYSNLTSSCKGAYICLGNISHISSSLIGTFVRVRKTIKDRNIHMGFIDASPETISLFRITGILDQFEFYHSETEIPF